MRKRCGIGLAAILIVIAIIGMLVGLLLPATQSSRSYPREDKVYSKTSGEVAGEGIGLEDAYGSPNASAMVVAQTRTATKSEDDTLRRADANRKIVYVADLSVVVEDVAAAEKRILLLVKELGGYVAEAVVNRTQGQELSGRWKVRIPDAKFDAFLTEVSKLGVVESRNQTTQDVTEEFVDLEAQVANKKELEKRVLDLLEKSTGAIADVIAVEQQLGRIRGEIERMEGRIKYLANQTDMTTVSIALREEQEYVPEAAPTFPSRLAEAWGDSLASLKAFGERLLVAAVVAAPWIAVASVVLVPSYWLVARHGRR